MSLIRAVPSPPDPFSTRASSLSFVLRGVLCFFAAGTLATTGTASGQYHIGVSLGGASTLALVAEHRWNRQGLEVQAGTWRLRDFSLSLTAKQYVGSSAVEPFLGVGLWGMVVRPGEGTGFGLIGRLPVGLNWKPSEAHSVALTVYLNRALALRRPDPEDRRPPRSTIIPLPEFSYRWRQEGR